MDKKTKIGIGLAALGLLGVYYYFSKNKAVATKKTTPSTPSSSTNQIKSQSVSNTPIPPSGGGGGGIPAPDVTKTAPISTTSSNAVVTTTPSVGDNFKASTPIFASTPKASTDTFVPSTPVVAPSKPSTPTTPSVGGGDNVIATPSKPTTPSGNETPSSDVKEQPRRKIIEPIETPIEIVVGGGQGGEYRIGDPILNPNPTPSPIFNPFPIRDYAPGGGYGGGAYMKRPPFYPVLDRPIKQYPIDQIGIYTPSNDGGYTIPDHPGGGYGGGKFQPIYTPIRQYPNDPIGYNPANGGGYTIPDHPGGGYGVGIYAPIYVPGNSIPPPENISYNPQIPTPYSPIERLPIYTPVRQYPNDPIAYNPNEPISPIGYSPSQYTNDPISYSPSNYSYASNYGGGGGGNVRMKDMNSYSMDSFINGEANSYLSQEEFE